MDANVKNDEFAKLTTRERIAYGGGDFAQNLVFGTVGGFLLTYLTTVTQFQPPLEHQFSYLFVFSMSSGIHSLEPRSTSQTLRTVSTALT